jgi:hypothetical protein
VRDGREHAQRITSGRQIPGPRYFLPLTLLAPRSAESEREPDAEGDRIRRLNRLAFITQDDVIQEILRHLDRWDPPTMPSSSPIAERTIIYDEEISVYEEIDAPPELDFCHLSVA